MSVGLLNIVLELSHLIYPGNMKRWLNVVAGWSTVNQRWSDVSYLLGIRSCLLGMSYGQHSIYIYFKITHVCRFFQISLKYIE